MNFTPDLPKQTVLIVFSRKSHQIAHPLISFNGIEIKTVNEHKHYDLILDVKLSFASHINKKNVEGPQSINI